MYTLAMLIAASAMITRASTAVISLVRSGVRWDSRRAAASGDRTGLRALPAPVSVTSASGVTPVTRKPFLRGREPQHVPDTAQGVDQPRVPGVDLPAQHGHVRLNDPGVTAEVVVPHVVQDLHLR